MYQTKVQTRPHLLGPDCERCLLVISAELRNARFAINIRAAKCVEAGKGIFLKLYFPTEIRLFSVHAVLFYVHFNRSSLNLLTTLSDFLAFEQV